LVLKKKRLRNYGTDTAGPSKRARVAMKWMKRTTIALGKAWKRRNQ